MENPYYQGPSQPICLFIGPMKNPESQTRDRFETVYSDLVVPAATEAGMRPFSVHSEQPGMITTRLLQWIKWSHVIVADLTTDNTSLGYELAHAHALRRCTSVLLKSGFKCPYDVRDMNRIEYDDDDVRNLRKSIQPLVAQIRHFAAMGWVSHENPIAQSDMMPLPVAFNPLAVPSDWGGSLADIGRYIPAATPNIFSKTELPDTGQNSSLSELLRKRYGK